MFEILTNTSATCHHIGTRYSHDDYDERHGAIIVMECVSCGTEIARPAGIHHN